MKFFHQFRANGSASPTCHLSTALALTRELELFLPRLVRRIMVTRWHCTSKNVDSQHAKPCTCARRRHFKVKWLGRHYLGEARQANYSNTQRSHLTGLRYPISTVRSEGWVNKCAPIGLAYRAPARQSDFVRKPLLDSDMFCLFVVNLYLTTAPYLWSRLLKREKSTDML